jgi:hypothetical protein
MLIPVSRPASFSAESAADRLSESTGRYAGYWKEACEIGDLAA